MATSKTPSKKTSPKKASSTTRSPETKLIRELAGILNATGLTEIEMEKGTLKIRVSKTSDVIAPPVQSYVAPAAAAPAAVALAPAVETPAPTSKADASAHPGAVKSPMVGTAYIRPSPCLLYTSPSPRDRG